MDKFDVVDAEYFEELDKGYDDDVEHVLVLDLDLILDFDKDYDYI